MRNLRWTHGKSWQNWSQPTTSHSPPSPHVHSICWEGLEFETIFFLGSLIHFSCTRGSMALKQAHWVKDQWTWRVQTHQNSCVAFNEFHKNLQNLLLCFRGFEVCVTCSIRLLHKNAQRQRQFILHTYHSPHQSILLNHQQLSSC